MLSVQDQLNARMNSLVVCGAFSTLDESEHRTVADAGKQKTATTRLLLACCRHEWREESLFNIALIPVSGTLGHWSVL